MKKKVLILLILILMTGCTVESNITINSDMTVDENINVAFDNSLAVNYNSPEDYANGYLKYYDSAISLKNYKYKIEPGKVKSYVNFTKKTNNICDSINYSLFSQYLYNKIDCIEEDSFFIIKSEGTQLISVPISMKKFNVESVILTVKLPVAAVENNADDINNNSYIWRYDETTSKDKSIYLKISKTQLEENKINIQEKEKQNKIFSILVSIFVLISIGLAVGIILYKRYKQNRIEY